jgi:MFS family permease
VAVAFEGLAVTTVMPTVVRDLGGLADYGWAFSAFMLANVVGITVAGRRTDRVGPWAPFAAGAAIFAAGLCLAGLAPTMLALIGARTVQGAGGGAVVGDLRRRRARIGGSAAAHARDAVDGVGAPGLVGPAVAHHRRDHASWRLVFFGLVPIVALAAASRCQPCRHRTDGHARRRGRPTAALLLSGGLALSLLGAQQRDLLIALPLLAAGIAIARPGFRRLMPAGTLAAAPGLPAAIAAMGLVSIAFLGTETFFPLLVTEVHHRSSTLAGLALSAATFTWTAGAWVQARLAPHRSRRGLVAAGALVLALGLAGLVLPLVDETPLWAGVVAWALAGLGMGIAHATISLVVLAEAAAGREGAASASMQLASVLGVALGAGAGGAAIAMATARGWGPRAGFGIGLAMTGSAALLAVGAAARLPLVAPAARRCDARHPEQFAAIFVCRMRMTAALEPAVRSRAPQKPYWIPPAG